MGVPSEWLESARRDRGAALMGVLNVTPDSFYDGGRYASEAAQRAQIDRMLAEGATIIDIGAESSRPGAEPVPAPVQLDRMDAALRHAVARGAVTSVDTTSPEVATRALERGSMSLQAGFSKYADDGYGDVVTEVRAEWRAARERAVAAGLPPEDVWFDPGLGFAKNARQSFELLARLGELALEGAPLVVGASRKSFIASLDGSAPADRLGGTIAAGLLAADSYGRKRWELVIWEAASGIYRKLTP